MHARSRGQMEGNKLALCDGAAQFPCACVVSIFSARTPVHGRAHAE
jgi:hypothetical protein